MRKLANAHEEGNVLYDIPGTISQAAFSLKKSGGSWDIRAGIRKKYAESSMISWLKFLPFEKLTEYLDSEQAVMDAETILIQMIERIESRH